MKLLEIKNLNKSFKDGKDLNVEVLKDLSFDLYKGESVCIIGNSGCGKSTFINILGLLLEPDSGEIIIDGCTTKNITSKKKAELRNSLIGYIVQDYALIEEESVFENIKIPFYYSKTKISKKIQKQKIYAALEQVGISDKIYDKVKYLSGGQRQRVAIARAIVNDPDIILADEPTGALDATSGESIFQLLMSLVSKNKSIILVTHNMNLAEMCDKQFVLENGCLTNVKKTQ